MDKNTPKKSARTKQTTVSDLPIYIKILASIGLQLIIIVIGIAILYKSNTQYEAINTVAETVRIDALVGTRKIDPDKMSFPLPSDSISYDATLVYEGFLVENAVTQLVLSTRDNPEIEVIVSPESFILCDSKTDCTCENCSHEDLQAGQVVKIVNSYEDVKDLELHQTPPTSTSITIQ